MYCDVQYHETDQIHFMRTWPPYFALGHYASLFTHMMGYRRLFTGAGN